MMSLSADNVGATSLLVAIGGISLIGLFAAPAIIRLAAFRPYWLLRNSEYWRLLSSGFVHANLSPSDIQPADFLLLCLCAGATHRLHFVPGTLFSGPAVEQPGTFWRHRREPDYVTVGASGAITAVLFASILYFPTSSLYILPLPVPIPAPLFAVLYLGYSYYQSVIRPIGSIMTHTSAAPSRVSPSLRSRIRAPMCNCWQWWNRP
ncbi:MAG: rhomboid family intramembrane serine protease [Steroidobacteraceae bacterium]